LNAPATAPAEPVPAQRPTGWRGELTLNYRRDGARTVAHDRHSGPLRVLRSLYPEGPGICHHVLVHPPGGIVGGDTLEIGVRVAAGAHALITTPGATRFYRTAGPDARQALQADVASGARLEWLPMETIVHSGARAVNAMRFALAPGAEMIGWDLLCLGLPASDAGFADGRFEQSLALPPDWLERGVIDASDLRSRQLMQSPLGFDGRSVLATLWCASGDGWDTTMLERLLTEARDALEVAGLAAQAGATAPTARVVVVRALAERVEPLWQALRAIRATWRQTLWELPPAPPRIWNT
jgi:urease accessory protein